MRYLPGILAMAAVVVASNILVQFLIVGGLLTWGAFTYPLAFLVTDVMNRLYGPSAARRVVFAGFLTGLACSAIGSQIMLQGDGYTYPAVALRVAFGSGIAFLTAQLVDIAVFSRLRSGSWWRAPVVSSLVGSTVDTALFFTLAFSASITWGTADIAWAQGPAPLLTVGPEAPLWVTLALADWGVKIATALVALVPFRLITRRFVDKSPQMS